MMQSTPESNENTSAPLPASGYDGVVPNLHSISVYTMAGNLVCVLPAAVLKGNEGANPTRTIEDLRLAVADIMGAPPGLLAFVPFGGDPQAERLSSLEDISNLREVQVVISLEKKEEYLQQGRKHLAGNGMTKGEKLEDFLWEELSNGSALRCAVVRAREEVDIDDMLIFGAIFENFQDGEALDEIFYFFDLQTEVIDPLVNNVLAPLNTILDRDRADKTASLIPIIVDWIEALNGAQCEERELHIDCFFRALMRHVEKNPMFWTLARRRAVWLRNAETCNDDEMGLSVLWDVFDRLISNEYRLATWPVVWNFMQRFAGIDIETFKRLTVPGLQTGSLEEHGYTPYCVYDTMRDHSEGWVNEMLQATDQRYMRNRQGARLREAFQDSQRRMQVTTDFWVSFMELFSMADIKAIREGSCSRDSYLNSGKATVDFLSFPLAMQIPFLRKCQAELGGATGLLNAHPPEKIDALDKILEIMDQVVAFKPKVGDHVEIHRLEKATMFNGKRGRIVALQNGDPIRYRLEFEDGSEGKAVKAANLKKRYTCD